MHSKVNYNKIIAFVATLAIVFSSGFFLDAPVYAGTSTSKSTSTTAEIIPQTVDFGLSTSAGIKEAAEKKVFWVEQKTDGNLKFVNSVHGYAITIPANMQPVDMSHSSLVSVLEDSHRHLEIYKSTVSVPAGYVGYGYKFLDNTLDHTLTYQETTTIGGKTAYIKEWQRAKLSRVEKDHNYYASVTLISGTTVYDFFFSSDVPFSECGGYISIPSSIFFFSPTAQGIDIKGESVARPNWTKETTEFYNKYYSSSSALTWGMYNRYYDDYPNDLWEKEKKMDYKFPILLHYSSLQPNDPSYIPGVRGILKNAWDDGRVIELTLQTPLKATGRNMMYGILDGTYDQFLHDFAKAVADFGHPVLFRPFNEMNGDWCNYSAYATSRDTEIYKEVYKYIYSIFEAQGANKNTIWVWNPNGKSYPNYAWNDQRRYYPGDEYVDIIGLTKYNTGSYYSGETWQSFNTCYYDLYAKATSLYNQPFMITEFASSSYGGDKVAWVKNMFYYIKNYDRIKVAIWWDGCDFAADGSIARSYFINDPAEVMDVFAHYIGGTQKNSNDNKAKKNGK